MAAGIDTGAPRILRNATLGNLTSAQIFHSIATLNPNDVRRSFPGWRPAAWSC